MRCAAFSFLLLCLCACGGRTNSASETSAVTISVSEGVKMRHQILFQNKDDSQVFDGYMLQFENAFMVKAFAGPGVDLFTVARSGEKHKETLHIQALLDRIDVYKIGEDIFCIYMEGCRSISDGLGKTSVQCVRRGRRVEETFNDTGQLTERRFPDAHGIGLTVRYLSFQRIRGNLLPQRIELFWGNSLRSLIIHTVSVEAAAPGDRAVIENFLIKP